MTKTNMDLSELLAKHDQGDLLCGIAEAVLQLIMEAIDLAQRECVRCDGNEDGDRDASAFVVMKSGNVPAARGALSAGRIGLRFPRLFSCRLPRRCDGNHYDLRLWKGTRRMTPRSGEARRR